MPCVIYSALLIFVAYQELVTTLHVVHFLNWMNLVFIEFTIFILIQKSNMELYIEREVKRREFVLQRWDMREKEKADNEAAAKRKAGVSIPKKRLKYISSTCL